MKPAHSCQRMYSIDQAAVKYATLLIQSHFLKQPERTRTDKICCNLVVIKRRFHVDFTH